MGAQGVQFRGIDAIMRAFDNCKITSWAVMYGKGINCKYAGTDEHESRETLSQFLQLLSQSGSTAVYTLHLYEDIPKGGKIKPSTDADYSYNFMLYDSENRSPFSQDRYNKNQELQDRITQLEAQLLLKDDDEDEDRSLGGIISGLIEDPRVKDFLINKGFEWADKLFNRPKIVTMPTEQQPASVGAIDQNSPVLIDEAQNVKISNALEILARCDPKLGDNLLKIAAIAQSDPGKYTLLSKML